MKEGYYGLISALPTALVSFVFLYIVRYILYGKRKKIVLSAFSGILSEKSDNSVASEGWLFKKVVIGNEDLSDKVFLGLFLVLCTLFMSLFVMFFQLLLLDVSYDCDEDDKTKDCFKYESWSTKRFSKDPVNCSSAAVQNGSVQVVCYKIVFNAGLAMGASYGTFKFSMVLINLAATGLLMIKQAKHIKALRITVAFLCLVVFAALIAVQFTTLRVHFVSETLATTFQMLYTLLIGLSFVFYIPWKELITLKNAQNEPEATGVDNTATDPV